MPEFRRGEVWFADLDPVLGSEQGGDRPVLVLQNNIANKYSPVTIVAIMTSMCGTRDEKRPDFVKVEKDSYVMCNQIRTLDSKRFRRKIKTLSNQIMDKIDEGIHNSMGLRLCPKCTAPIEKGAQICRWCKEPVRWKCPDCGQIINIEFRFCPNCGQPYRCIICDKIVSISQEVCECGMILLHNCFNCNEKFDGSYAFCPYCGHRKDGDS